MVRQQLCKFLTAGVNYFRARRTESWSYFRVTLGMTWRVDSMSDVYIARLSSALANSNSDYNV
jgi:hypothetical protein